MAGGYSEVVFFTVAFLPEGFFSRIRLSQRPCEARFLGSEIGASQSTLPVGAERFRRTPHIALSGAFLALHPSVCNRWPRRWVSGRRRERRPGRTCRIPALLQSL